MLVIKANGKEEDLSAEKIAKSIRNAILDCEDASDELEIVDFDEDEFADEICDKIDESFDKTIESEEVRRIVVGSLIAGGYENVAIEYMNEGMNRARKRESESLSMKTIEEIIYSDAAIKKENANIKSNTSMGAMLRIGSENSKLFALMRLYPKDIADAHIEGDIHMHDLDFSMLTMTCDQIPAIKLLMNGIKGTGDGTRECGRIGSAANVLAVIIQANQNDQYGGQSIPMFDYYLAPFVSKTFYKLIVEICLIRGIFGVNKEEAKQIKKELRELWLKDNHLMDDSKKKEVFACIRKITLAKYRKDTFDSVWEMAKERTDEETKQAMEAFISNMNTMHSRAGAQVPFSSINYGTDTSEEGRMVIKNILLATYEGIGGEYDVNGVLRGSTTPTFPIQIWKERIGVNYNPEDKNYDLFVLAARVAARRMYPNMANLDVAFNRELIVEGHPETEIAYMGCRTRVGKNMYDKSKSVIPGRGNVAFISINLPRIAILSNGNIKAFYRLLDERLELVHRAFMRRLDILGERKAKDFPFLMGQHLWIGSEMLKPEDSIKEVLKQGTFAFGFIGLAEALIALTGKHHGESKKSQKLGLEIIKHMRKYADAISEYEKLNYSIIGTPAEGLSNRFTILDRRKFGEIAGITDKGYYTNSSHVPVSYNISAFEKIHIEAPYHELENGGHILYVEYPGDPEMNFKGYLKLIREMHDAGAGYYAINRPIDYDSVCGYEGIINDVCPCCGRKEYEALSNEKYNEIITKESKNDVYSEFERGQGKKFQRKRRITGYLVEDTDNWGAGKLAELNDRVNHGTGSIEKRVEDTDADSIAENFLRGI